MTAVLVPAATEEEWLTARLKGVTASEIAVVMGLSPWDSPYALYHRKLGLLPPGGDDDAMAIGRHMESFVAARFATLRPEFGVGGDGRTLFAHSGRPWQLATPDRILFDPARISGPDLGVLECKVDAGDGEHWGEDGSDQIPVHYRCQVLWQCDVMGTSTWYVACLDWRSRKIRVYTGTIDDDAEADLILMRAEASAFLKRIEQLDPPEIDWRPQTTAALKHLNQGVEDVDVTVGAGLARSYRAAVRRYEQAKERKALLTNRMLAAIGTGRRALDPHGDRVATRSTYPETRIDTGQLRRDHPAVAKACERTQQVTKLLPAKPKDDQ